MDTTQGTSTTLSLDQLGPAGTRGDLCFLAITKTECRTDNERLTDQRRRKFIISAYLTKNHQSIENIKTNFNAEDGNSFIRVPPSYDFSRVRFRDGMFEIKKNAKGEESFIEFECDAEDIDKAKTLFLTAVLPFLDHQSYLANCPIFLGPVRVEDQTNLVTCIDYISPHRAVTITPHVKALKSELAPVYALYRDAKNSHSNFYSFLCHHKILEGLLGSTRATIRKRAAQKKLTLSARHDLVPNSDYISPEFHSWREKPVKKFFDDVMTPQFRNAVAHFIAKDGNILNLSSPSQLDRYSSILYISELCSRVVIETMETWLHELSVKGSGKIEE